MNIWILLYWWFKKQDEKEEAIYRRNNPSSDTKETEIDIVYTITKLFNSYGILLVM